jgi:hypothetical protein
MNSGGHVPATRLSAGEWQQLKPMILGAIMEHFMSGVPLLTAGGAEVKRQGRQYT